MVLEFRLSPPGSKRGVSCDENGAFVGAIPLLEKSLARGKDHWRPRDNAELSKQLGSHYALPIDMSSKTGRLKAIANALNDGDLARAQIATVLLAIPDPPTLSKSTLSHSEAIKFIRDLHWSGLIKADWDADDHPRWPAGAPNTQGGRFAPKGDSESSELVESGMSSGSEQAHNGSPPIPIAANSRDDISHNPPGRKSEEECERQYDYDMYICGSLRDKQERAICRSSATQRYAACLAGKPLPPLTLPDPESDFSPLPATPPTHRWPSSPPSWLPLFFVPWFFGVPA